MKKSSRNKAQLNNGFTLVELIVSIAIFAIVAAAIIAFFRVAMTQYRSNTSEVNVQTESQLTWRRLESNVLATTSGIWLPAGNDTDPKVSGADTEIDLYSYDRTKDSNQYIKTCIYSKENDDKNRIYYQDFYSDNGKNWVPDEDYREQVFSQMVTEFSVKMYDEDGNEIVTPSGVKPVKMTIHIKYDTNSQTNDGKTYNSDNTVAIRNTVVASNNSEVIYRDKDK